MTENERLAICQDAANNPLVPLHIWFYLVPVRRWIYVCERGAVMPVFYMQAGDPHYDHDQ